MGTTIVSYALALLSVGAAPSWESGSLLLLHHSKKSVAYYTRSDVTHVALVLRVSGRPYVFEATPAEVRGMTLMKYFAEMSEEAAEDEQLEILVIQPKEPYSAEQRSQMYRYVKSQLGRRYSVKGYVRKRQAEGIHCAEFVSTALDHSGRFEFQQRYAISPGELVKRVEPLHEPPIAVAPPPAREESWCSKAWRKWSNFKDWCAWASYETWRFCW